MAINRIIITHADKYQTTVYPYFTDQASKGSVLILHGMAEHHERYLPFVEFLNSNGYDAFLYDHRGHGTDKKFEDLGHFADTNGYNLVTGDAIDIIHYIQSNNRGDRFILFGHSMGSIIARNVIEQYDNIDAAVICGTNYMSPFAAKMGLLIAKIVRSVKGPHYYSPFLNNLCVGYKDFAKISNRTAYDWLTRDNNIVGTYINDPFCGFICTTSFYCDLIKLTQLAATPKLIRQTRRDLPILLISGSHDPVGSYGQGVTKLFALLQRYGFAKSDCTLYEECRHELLNELNSDAVMQDIVSWINGPDGEPSEA